MKKTIVLSVICLFISFASRARLQVTANVETITGPNNCCYTLWVSVDDVDEQGHVMTHKVHGYVKLGCCAAGVALNGSTDNTACTPFIYNNEAFITANDSHECLLAYIQRQDVYPGYVAKRDEAIRYYQSAHK